MDKIVHRSMLSEVEMTEICRTCKQPVLDGQPRNGITSEHWTCYKQRPRPEAKPMRFFPKLHPTDHPIERYRRWWLGKRCRRIGSLGEFKLVTRVEWIGAPSGFSGIVELTFEDGTTELVSNTWAYKPRKSDVEVEDATKAENDPETLK